jgi:dihydropteroate synthase
LDKNSIAEERIGVYISQSEKSGSLEMPELEVGKLREIPLSGGRSLKFNRPLAMGALNATPDSFSDGGKFYMWDAAVARAREIISEGADILDIGGESSRPGSDPVTEEEESERVIPVIKSVRQFSDIPISVDTTKASIAAKALAAGADIINDISAARFDKEMIPTVVRYGAPIILMHMLGRPKTMQVNPHYDNCVEEIKRFLKERVKYCESRGISGEKIIVDPGIGFGKRLKDNLAIINHIGEFKKLGCPVLLGLSRKSFIGMLGGSQEPDKRLGGSIAAAIMAIRNGADIIRAHDVAATIEAIKVLMAIEGAA